MRYLIYCDESGEASFTDKSRVKYFGICAISIDATKKKKIQNTLKKKEAKLYKLGWPKEVEIKATVLHNLRHQDNIPDEVKNAINGDDVIKNTLLSLSRACYPRVDYIVVNKDYITSESFRNSPYGVAYNFFAGKILVPLILDLENCLLTVDQRNKEMHHHKHFDGYIETKLSEESFESRANFNLEDIKHDESRSNWGLRAADYFSWAVYRKIANNDSRFFNVFKDILDVHSNEWYCSK